MSVDVDLVPEWARAITNAPVHEPPPQVGGGWQAPMPWQQLVATVRFFLDSFIGQIAVALGGIEILGWKPLEFLAQWGQDRIAEASAAYIAATTAQEMAGGAQNSADTANTGVAILNARVNGIISGGVSIYDSFSRSVSDMANDPDWDVAYAGGSGNMYLTTDNDGRARWYATGFSDTSFIARHKTALSTNRVRVSVVIDDFTYGYAGNQAHIWLMARMDATRKYTIIGIVEDGLAEIGYFLNGNYTRIGGAESVSTNTGDLWDLEVGVGSDDWRFRLLQNNALRVDRTDLGHLSMKDTTPGTTYKYAAFGGDCAIGAGPFGTTYQIGMPDTQVFAAADY